MIHPFRRQPARILILVALAASMLAPGSSPAQNASSPDYVPQVGQQGKDVIWVPTPQALVERMLLMKKR